MRDFPLDELLSATNLEKVKDAIVAIFAHLNKKLRISPYPIRRALPLVEAISGDLNSQLHSLLSGRRLMHLEYREFDALMEVAQKIFSTWDDNVNGFTNVARDVTRKRSERFIPIKISARHLETQERIAYIRTFRHGHEQLQRTIANVLGPNNAISSQDAPVGDETGDVDAVEEVSQAYAVLKDVDVLDVSPEGTDIWIFAENAYNERTSRVENSIIARLRDRLATAKTASEMFRVFSKFNALFVRPKIRGAIQEYQTQLIDSVKQDIAALHERFKQQYGHSEAHAMAQLHDLPPISGAIIWARQIERQLNAYMKRIEDVLGRGWELYAEGQRLQGESNTFKKKLDTKPIYDSWLNDVTRRNISISGRLFSITRNRAAGNTLELVVNFDPQVIALFKEVRNLIWLNYQVPHAINNISKEAKRVYPYAVSLMETCRTLAQTNRTISEMPEVSILLSGYQNDVNSLITRGIPLKWESFVHSYDLHVRQLQYLPNGNIDPSTSLGGRESRHVQFVRDFAAAVSLLQAKTSTLAVIYDTIQKAMSELHTCPYAGDAFQAKIEVIQAAVDQLNLENYVNLTHWVGELNQKIEAIFLSRLHEAVVLWIDVFSGEQTDGVDSDIIRKRVSRGDGDSVDGLNKEDGASNPKMKRLVHEIGIRNQVIYLDPPLEFARASWFSQLHEWVGIVCNLQKLKASRYEMNLNLEASDIELFSELVRSTWYLTGTSC
jgi:dynein heavy chain 1